MSNICQIFCLTHILTRCYLVIWTPREVRVERFPLWLPVSNEAEIVKHSRLLSTLIWHNHHSQPETIKILVRHSYSILIYEKGHVTWMTEEIITCAYHHKSPQICLMVWWYPLILYLRICVGLTRILDSSVFEVVFLSCKHTELFYLPVELILLSLCNAPLFPGSISCSAV
jgi:hypothetical protein